MWGGLPLSRSSCKLRAWKGYLGFRGGRSWLAILSYCPHDAELLSLRSEACWVSTKERVAKGMFDEMPERAVDMIQGKTLKPGTKLVKLSSDICKPTAKDRS